jgi:serine phosphatase RsbU (regulator of sigma subunit)
MRGIRRVNLGDDSNTDFAPPPDDRTQVRAAASAGSGSWSQRGWAHFLVFEDASGTLQRLRLSAEPLRLGRRPPCELVLRDAEVSGLHCQVSVQGDEVTVQDLGSTNGTFVQGERVARSLALPPGGALQVGSHVFRHELRDENELAQSAELSRDLERARRYLQSLLPPPLRSGPLQVEWHYEPSAQVGGDGFGYQALDEHRLALYVIDVCGHGVGAAMHAVAVMNALRQRALPDTDLAQPGRVLERLNAMFQMDAHDGMFFTIWYGVYDARNRRLAYAGGGHHPAYVLGVHGATLRPLHTRNLVVGALPDAAYLHDETTLEPGDRLYVFSDGVFEISTRDGRPWGLAQFLRLAGMPPAPGMTEPEQLYAAVCARARPGPLEDDFCVLVAKVA